MSALLEVRRLDVFYGHVPAVRNVSFTVEAGQLVTIIGANGAGKTTLLNAVAGLIPAHGDISFGGVSLTDEETEDRVLRGLCLVPEQRELFATMSVADNLLLGGFTQRRDAAGQRQRLAEVYECFPRLLERRPQMASTLSGGERQMLAIGRALMSRPALLMLDEPSLGLAPLLVQEVFRVIARLRSLGVAVLLVEQNARAALEAADYAYVMDTGEISIEGPASQLLRDPRVTDVYLGRSAD
jgi:branched-chain amino acid transport system ATP-binding protein